MPDVFTFFVRSLKIAAVVGICACSSLNAPPVVALRPGVPSRERQVVLLPPMGADGSLLELDPLQFELGYINAWVGHVGFEFLKPLPAKLVSSIPGAASVFGKIIVALQSDVMAQIPGVRELLLKIEEAVGGALGKPLLAVVRVDGNKGSYDGGADVSVSVSLFDPFRLSPAWTASAAGKKGVIPIPFELFLSSVVGDVLTAVAEQQVVPDRAIAQEIPEVQPEAKPVEDQPDIVEQLGKALNEANMKKRIIALNAVCARSNQPAEGALEPQLAQHACQAAEALSAEEVSQAAWLAQSLARHDVDEWCKVGVLEPHVPFLTRYFSYSDENVLFPEARVYAQSLVIQGIQRGNQACAASLQTVIAQRGESPRLRRLLRLRRAVDLFADDEDVFFGRSEAREGILEALDQDPEPRHLDSILGVTTLVRAPRANGKCTRSTLGPDRLAVRRCRGTDSTWGDPVWYYLDNTSPDGEVLKIDFRLDSMMHKAGESRAAMLEYMRSSYGPFRNTRPGYAFRDVLICPGGPACLAAGLLLYSPGNAALTLVNLEAVEALLEEAPAMKQRRPSKRRSAR